MHNKSRVLEYQPLIFSLAIDITYFTLKDRKEVDLCIRREYMEFLRSLIHLWLKSKKIRTRLSK